MSTRLRTSVDSVCILGGVWQDKVSNMAVFERGPVVPARHGRGNLYILVETVGSFPDPARIQQRLIEVAEERFRTDGSITNALREAIKAANASLFEQNLNAPREERGIAGMTCLVLKEQDAYIGQAGPGLLYHVAKDTFQRLPQESAWLSAEKLQDVDIAKHPPLGLRREIEPELSHLHSQSSDVFILASTRMIKLAGDDQVRSAVIHRGAHSVRENLETYAAGKDLALMIVELLEADQAAAPAERPEALVTRGKRPGIIARVSSTLRKLATPPLRGAMPQEEEPEPGEEFPVAAADEDAQEETEHGPGIDLRGMLQSAWNGARRLVGGLLPILGNVLPKAESERKRLPPRLFAGPRAAARSGQKTAAQSEKRWIWVALAVPVIVILLYAVTRFQYERSRQARLTQFLQAAEAAKASVESSPTTGQQRARLREAIAALDQAVLLKPGDQTLIAERDTLQSTLDEKNYVSRLFYFGKLEDFPDVGDVKCQLSTVVVHDIDVYVLDVGTDRVYKYLLTPTKDSLQDLPGEHVLVRKGDQHGTIVLDELLDITWADPGAGLAGAGLLIVDKKGQVLRYDPAAGLEVSPVADSGSWRAPAAAATFNANLYLLDPPANAVLKYERTAAGYDAPSSNYFKPEANANVVSGLDLAIDGSVYVLNADGTISKYFKGAGVPFPLTNLDEPLRGACCIFASGESDQEGYVYVADTGNQRILRFSKEGVFLGQYRGRDPQEMSTLRGLFVDEADKRLYITDGNKLYWAKLP